MYRSSVVVGLVVSVAVALGACARVAGFANGETGTGGNSGMPGAPGTTDVDLAPPSLPLDLAMPASDSTDLATPPPADLATARDLATPPADLAQPPADLAQPPADLATTPSTCHPVINEVQTGTTQTGTEEFVELYNPCSAAVTVTGWKLVYRASSNTNPATGADSSTLYTFGSGSLAAGAYRVLGGSGYKGAADGVMASGIAAAAGVGLRDDTGALVDSVGFGSVGGNAFVETAAAPAPPTLSSPGGSIERLPNGADSNDNSHDFKSANTATPGAANH